MNPTSRTARPSRPTSQGPSAVPDDRRTRLRLRELCDEVLASYRVASAQELLSNAERREARAMLREIVPAMPLMAR